ncbi:unnamed protein product [Diatraea saccharalis]|uniref:Uncharacterized protein n=1 Tax=Diatraea saccharalis TaxID=40085 RepID=A0A9N9RDU6_9NEOP|nr:unnamed protein product [Diatraea saccharalis]
MANYTGNNTTMEMDITESSFVSTETSFDDSSYLSGLRNIRGRRSYKPLKEMTLRHLTEKHVRPDTSGTDRGHQHGLAADGAGRIRGHVRSRNAQTRARPHHRPRPRPHPRPRLPQRHRQGQQEVCRHVSRFTSFVASVRTLTAVCM